MAFGCGSETQTAQNDASSGVDANFRPPDAAVVDDTGVDAGPPPVDAWLQARLDGTMPVAGDAVRLSTIAFTDPDPAIHLALINTTCEQSLWTDPFPALMITPSINGVLSASLNNDANGDGLLDLSILAVIDDASSIADGGTLTLYLGAGCVSATECERLPGTPLIPLTLPFQYVASGGCATVEQSARDNGANTPGDSQPCIRASAPGALPFPLDFGMGFSFTITFEDLTVAAEVGTDGSLSNALIRGFLSRETARAIVLYDDPAFSIEPPITLEAVLPGGATPETCTELPPTAATSCTHYVALGGIPVEVGLCGDPAVDIDTGPSGSEGWWVYINFTAAPTTLRI